jgi:hypothetical protein
MKKECGFVTCDFFTDEANFNLSGYVNSQAYGVRLAQTVSLDRYLMLELLMLNDILLKYSFCFSLI